MCFFPLFSASFFTQHTVFSVWTTNNVFFSQLELLSCFFYLTLQVYCTVSMCAIKGKFLLSETESGLMTVECVVTRTDEWHFALFYLEPVASLCEPGNLRKTASRLNRKISACFHLNWEIMNKDTIGRHEISNPDWNPQFQFSKFSGPVQDKYGLAWIVTTIKSIKTLILKTLSNLSPVDLIKQLTVYWNEQH